MSRSGLSARGVAALALLIVAFSCHCTSTKEATESVLLLSRLGVAVVEDGTETIEVTATDEHDQPLPFSVRCDPAGIATVSKTGRVITVTGLSCGTAALMIRCGASRKTVPVQVYDPMVLETDELLIAFVDKFEWSWNTEGHSRNGVPLASFFQPVATNGFKAFGSVGVLGIAHANKKTWAMVVKAKPGSNALKHPIDYRKLWDTKDTGRLSTGRSGKVSWEVDSRGKFDKPASIWIPVPCSGYKALGSVVQRGYAKPDVDDVVCVREDMTVTGCSGDGYFMRWTRDNSELLYLSAACTPAVGPHDSCYLPTGTLVAWYPGVLVGPMYDTSLNLLRVALPMLAETPPQSFLPQLTGYDEPPRYTKPTMAKEVLVPWTVLRDSGLTHMERVHTSPFYRLERQVYYERCDFRAVNTTSLTQPFEARWTKGTTVSESETKCEKSGVSITVETGVSCGIEGFGTEMKVGTTVSRELGYEQTSGIEEFKSEEIVIPFHVAPGKAVGVWNECNRFILKRHNGTKIEPICTWEIEGSSFAVDEYPDD